MVTSTVNLEGIEHVYSIGNTKVYTALAIMPVLGVNSVAAVIAAAKKAQISQRERDKKLRWLFTAKDIEAMAHRPGRGRPVGSGHPNGPRKAKETVATDATSATNVTMETPNTDAVANTTSVAIVENIMDVDTDGSVEFYD